MANLVNIFLCVLFYSCVVTGTKSKLKVSSGDVFNGDKTVQNTNDRIRNEKLNFVHTQTGNYRMKSNVLHEKTCEGKDCMTKANGKSEVNARGRLRRKRKRNGHTQRKDLKVSKIASYSPSEVQLKNKRSRKEQSKKSGTQVHLRKSNSKHANRNKKNGRRKGKVQKSESKTEITKTDLKLPQRETEIKIGLPKIHGFRIINSRRPRVNIPSEEKETSQTTKEYNNPSDLATSDVRNINIKTPEIEIELKRKQVDNQKLETHKFQRQLRKKLNKNVNMHKNSGNERSKIESKDDTDNNKKTKMKIKYSTHSKKNNEHKQKNTHTNVKNVGIPKKTETKQRQLHLSPNYVTLSPPKDSRKSKLPRLSHDTLQLSSPSSMHNRKLSSNIWTHQNDRRYQNYRRPQYQRAPAGVGRLEQRLHPSLWTSLSSLKHNMETVLFRLREKVNRVNHDHDMLYNKTRYEVMSNVREQLKHIAEENDRAYDVVLDVSQLIRYIYLRAHNHGLMSPGPRELGEQSRIAELKVKDFSPDFRRTDRMLHQTRDTFRKVMEAKRTCMRQESKTKDMLHKVKNSVPKRELDDMDRILRRLITKQNNDMHIRYAQFRLRRYQNRYSRMVKQVENARNFSQMSFSNLREAQKRFLQNKEYQRMINEAKEGKRRQKRSTYISRAELKRLSARAYRHARNLQKVTETIERYLIPLLAKATNLTGGSTQNVVKAQIRVIIGRVKNLIKKYERKFDEIRILLGDDDVLKQRCEYLFELGGFSEELTPIDCEDFGIYSGSGDLPVSTMSPTTAAPSSTPRTVSTPSNSEDKDEGSATSDFEFIDSDGEKTEKPAEGGGWFFGDDPMAGNRDLFREKLQEVALSNRTKSEQIYARVEKIEMRFNALSERWNRFLSKVDLNAKYVDLATSISHSWGDAKPYIEEIRQNIVTAHEIITKKVEKINEKLPSILQKANETLSKLQQNNTDDKSKENTGISVLQDLITAVDKSKSNMALIKNIQVAHTTPCKKVETFATQLRTNIAELRKKIEKTRDITSSMKLTISMGGEGYISVPLKSKKDLLPTTSLQMCIKPSGSDMNVAQFYDNKTAVYSVHIKDSVPIVSVYDYKGEKYGDVKGPSSLNDDQWYSIRIDRFGHTVKLSTRDMSKSLETQATMVNAFPDLIPFQNSPVAAYIGGVPQDNADDGNSQFIGCIGEVMVDGRNVGLHSQSGKTNICTDRCSSKPNMSVVFEGNGYVKFPLRLVSTTYDMDNLRLNFTTRQKDGIIFLLNHRTQMFQVLISLTEGSLHVEARTKRGTTVLRSGSGIYANGKTHHILITFGTDKIDVLTDNGTDTFLAETRTQEITSRLDSGIYLGGLGSTSQPLSGKAKLRPLVGCISHLKINENEIPMFLMEESKNAHLGSCTNNIWTQCVWFDSSSSPITLDESEDGSRIYAVVNGESQGSILQYKSGEYFDIQISLTADGINVYDALEDENKMLQCSFHHWYILEIMDRNKKVHISCHSEKVIIGYSCGWTGFCGKMKYSLTIGGSEDGGTRLIGGILEILVNDKSIPLVQYIDDHKLTSCHHQPSEPLENEIIEKPVCA